VVKARAHLDPVRWAQGLIGSVTHEIGTLCIDRMRKAGEIFAA
jgi:hypothetical protein